MDMGERGIWQGMIRRCTPGLPGSEYWGDKGVTVCAEWAVSFDAFLEDVGPRPSLKHSIDRYPDPYGNYEPANVRWADAKEQRANQRERAPRTRENAKRQVFSAFWEWMYKWRYSDQRMAKALAERSGRRVSARQVSRWKKGFGFPTRVEHIRAIEALTGVTFQNMIDDKARADAKARRLAVPPVNPDGSDFPAERAFA